MDIKSIEKRFPGWTVKEPPIGKGGFATVYEIVKTDALGSEEHAALKVITIPENSADITAYQDDGLDDESITAIYKSQVDEITKEFKLMSNLKGNSNIVSYEDHDIIQHDNDPGWDILIRMELLTSLPDYFKANFKDTGIDENTVAKIGIDICKALELCEKHNIIHRDIKPQNIFVNQNGDFKLGDFGVARVSDHTTKATKAGTYGYMAPEIYNAQKYNASVDQYSLGLVMYWLLNERRGPFLPLPPEVPTSNQNSEALIARMNGEAFPAPMNGSDKLKEIVLKACAFSPEERFESPVAMREALEDVYVSGWVPGIIPLGNSKRAETVEGPIEVFPIPPQPPAPESEDEDETLGKNYGHNKGEQVKQIDKPEIPDNPPEPPAPAPVHHPAPEPPKSKKRWGIFAAAAVAVVAIIAVAVSAGSGTDKGSTSQGQSQGNSAVVASTPKPTSTQIPVASASPTQKPVATATPTAAPTQKPVATPVPTPVPTTAPKYDYVHWSTWSETPVTGTDTRQVKTKTQYRYTTYSLEYVEKGWSSLQDSYPNPGYPTTVGEETLYLYYYYVCQNCGAHVHGHSQGCYTWIGGCGSDSVYPDSYNCGYTTTPYSSFGDWYGTGVMYTNTGNGIGFAYTNPSSPYYRAPVTQYKYMIKEEVRTETGTSDWSDDYPHLSGVKGVDYTVEERTMYSYSDLERVN